MASFHYICALFVFFGLFQRYYGIETYYMDSHCGDTSYDIITENAIRIKYTAMSDYPANAECTYTISADSRDRMMIYFRNLDTEMDEDYLYFYDGMSADDTEVSGLFGGVSGHSKPSGVYTTTADYLTLRFHSDDNAQYSGFDIIVTQYHTGYCYSYETTCDNGRCIDDSIACNGYNPCGDHSDCSLSGGAIAGIVIASIVTIGVILSVIVICNRRRRGVIVRSPVVGTGYTVTQTTVPVGAPAAPPPYTAAPQYGYTQGPVHPQYLQSYPPANQQSYQTGYQASPYPAQ